MKRILVVTSWLLLSVAFAVPAMAANYVIVISNGRGMDLGKMYVDLANVDHLMGGG